MPDLNTPSPSLTPPSTQSGRGLGRVGALLSLAGMLLIYAVVVVTHWNRGYIDFGDGNYMYISWRITQGQVLYRDILAPQPPMHLLTGSVIFRVGQAIGDPLVAFRAFSLLLRLATAVLVYLCVLWVAGGALPHERVRWRGAGTLAAAIYLFLPLGFWWSQGYQSEPLEMFFFMLSFLLLLSWTRGRAFLAGIVGALPVLTNMTAAPYALFTLAYVAVRRPRLLLAYAIPFVLIVATTVIGMERWTGAYLENVILNQVGSFPRENPVGYAIGKIMNEGADILHLEGGFVVLALLGLLAYARSAPLAIREYVTWYSFFALCSFIYVSKGGTMDYIFTIAEPFVAIFAALMIVQFRDSCLGDYFRTFNRTHTSAAAGVFAAALLVLVLCGVGLRHSWRTLNQETYELDEFETGKIVELIRQHSKDYQLMLGPPFYAVLAERRLAEDYSELFLWHLKYHNEKSENREGRAIRTARRIGEQLQTKTIAFVVYDEALMSQIPEIRKALEENYVPLRQEPFKTLNTTLQFYIPRK